MNTTGISENNFSDQIKYKNEMFFFKHRDEMTSKSIKKSREFNFTFISEKPCGTNEFIVYLLNSLKNFDEQNFDLNLFQEYIDQLQLNSSLAYNLNDRNEIENYVNLLISEKLDGVVFESFKFINKLNCSVINTMLDIILTMVTSNHKINEKIINLERIRLILQVAHIHKNQLFGEVV